MSEFLPNNRIIGFDLARAYAIFGMYIVNFNFCFGSIWQSNDPLARFLNLFTGNSTSIFIILAGMGLSLMSNKDGLNEAAKSKLESIVLKRSWFLLALGLLLYPWWQGDILHFYGSYMHIAAFILFVPKRYYLWSAVAVIAIYHVLLLFFNVETGWDLTNYSYRDFWTPLGFLRNTLFNGWNAVFPWVAYFLLGMYLGKLNWQDKTLIKKIFLIGLGTFIGFEGIRFYALKAQFSPPIMQYIMSEYFPPFLPFMVLTASFAFIMIAICLFIGDTFSDNKLIRALLKTGQMTLSHYVIHLTLGMIILQQLTHKSYTGFAQNETPTPPIYILLYAVSWFVLSVLFSVLWRKYVKNGPLEWVMRKISD
jgi:uncharacterized protein